MLTQGFGEILTDIMTINPALSSVSSASAILDTSNFTFYAVSLSKDCQGFKTHAHLVSSSFIGIGFSGTIINSGLVATKRYNSTSPSSYHSSATRQYFSSIYTSSLPSYPSIYDRKLEKTTKSSFQEYFELTNSGLWLFVLQNNPAALIDYGHYANYVIDNYNTSFISGDTNFGVIFNSSGLWNIFGGYPPSGNSSIYFLTDSNGTFVTSGNLSGVYNTQGVVDLNGFIRINPFVNALGPSAGPILATSGELSALPAVYVKVPIQMGDAAALALFGGVTQIGIWCLDVKEMLKSGLTPPYSWSNVNTNRKYKLVAKTTFWNDILLNDDFNDISGLQRLALGIGYTHPYKGPCVILQIKF